MELRRQTFLYIGLFTVVWIATFNAAYVNGDDVVHMSGEGAWDIFLPKLWESWIPNRVVDLYGRSLITAVFDFFYFPLKAVFATDFFLAYKFYTATVFAGFITIVFSYIINNARFQLSKSLKYRKDRGYIFVVDIFLATMLIMCLPFKNQVHLVVYQLPAFISFVLLTELTKVAFVNLNDSAQAKPIADKEATEHYPSIILLISFFSAFSLSVYAATISMSVVLAWIILMVSTVYWSRKTHSTDMYKVLSKLKMFIYGSLGAFVFCSLSLLITAMFSNRVSHAYKNESNTSLSSLEPSFTGQSEIAQFFSLHGYNLLILALISFLIFQASLSLHQHVNQAKTQNLPFSSQRDYYKKIFVFFLSTIIICVSSLFVTFIISKVSGRNYFSHSSYPWGDFLLIAKFSLVFFTAVSFYQIRSSSYGLKNTVVLLVFIVMSKYVFMFTSATHDNYIRSGLVEQSYSALFTHAKSEVETGLNLNEIPMQIKPLPTKNDPAWFVEGHRQMFEKYYDIKDTPLFR